MRFKQEIAAILLKSAAEQHDVIKLKTAFSLDGASGFFSVAGVKKKP